MAKKQKVQMPAGIRNKLMAAMSMLLVSSIMMVSTTYAWFTLSTAPEVTGITTSVGANGNLEMALLTSETFTDLAKITSGVGNSSAASGNTLVKANATWGNLVDLSDASYGLNEISLQPARLNFATKEADGRNVTYDESKLKSAANLLLTPTYGADGRVDTVTNQTYATTHDGQVGWKYVENGSAYGVRAIGSNDSLTAQEAGLIAARAAYNSSLNSAKSTMQTSLAENGSKLADAIMVLAVNNDENTTLTDTDQQDAVKALVSASDKALSYIDSAYKQVLLAYAANAIADADEYNAAVGTITNANDCAAAVEAYKEAAGAASTPIDEALETLTEQKAAVTAAKTALEGEPDYKAALGKLVDTKSENVKISGFKVSEVKDGGGNVNSDFISAAFKDLYVEMGDNSGLFAYVGSVAGNYSTGCKVTITYGNLTLNNVDATMKTNATVDTTFTAALSKMSAASSTGADTYLSDTYGYALDFAFRTNAAGSYLKLQTSGVQRVYSDSNSEVTQGGGSKMTFQVTKDNKNQATLKDTQVTDLMSAIRVAFIDPGTGAEGDTSGGTIYAIAALDKITGDGNGSFTGDLYLKDYAIGENGTLTLSPKADKDSEGKDVDTAKLIDLDQSVAKRLTVIVWLDGDIVDNSDVANAAQSLIGSMNLQFSSSAELVPMSNTALENMELTYTKNVDAGDKYTFNGVEYTVKTGYSLYKGNDGKMYFAANVAEGQTAVYTELTLSNYATALEKPAADEGGSGS